MNGQEEVDGDVGNEKEDEDDEVVADMDKGESMGAKAHSRVDDELEYEGEDEERAELNASEDEENELANDVDEQVTTDVADQEIADNLKTINLAESRPTEKQRSKKMSKERVRQVLNISELIASYSYDAENSKWFSITFKVN